MSNKNSVVRVRKLRARKAAQKPTRVESHTSVRVVVRAVVARSEVEARFIAGVVERAAHIEWLKRRGAVLREALAAEPETFVWGRDRKAVAA